MQLGCRALLQLLLQVLLAALAFRAAKRGRVVMDALGAAGGDATVTAVLGNFCFEE